MTSRQMVTLASLGRASSHTDSGSLCKRRWSHTGCAEAREQGHTAVTTVEASRSVFTTQAAMAPVESISSVLRSRNRPRMNVTVQPQTVGSEAPIRAAGEGGREGVLGRGTCFTGAQDDYGIVLVEAETKDWRMGCKGPEHWSVCVVSALKPGWPQGDLICSALLQGNTRLPAQRSQGPGDLGLV